MSSARRPTRPTLLAFAALADIDTAGLKPAERATMDAFVQGCRRRWALIGLVTVFNLLASNTGTVVISGGAVVAAALFLAGVNVWSSTLPRSVGYRPSLPHLALALDLMVLATPLLFLGSSIVSPFLLLGLLPYAAGDTVRSRWIHCTALPIALFGALSLHSHFLAGETWNGALVLPNLVAAAALFVTGAVLRFREAGHLARISRARDVIERAASGALYGRAEEGSSDGLGQLTGAVNAMLIRITGTITRVKHDAQEVSAFAEMLSISTEGVLGSTQNVLETTKSLAEEMDSQRERAEDGHDRTADAAAAADSLRDRADSMATGVQQLVAEAQMGREHVLRASEKLISIARDVKTSAATIQVLSAMSNDIGNFVHTTSRIARQTHVLALNAAIEAAHSGAGNEGFSAVAEEVRALAATSASSARHAAELIEAVQTHIGTVAQSMGAGEEQVRDVGAVAGEAKRALDALVSGASEVSELVRITADVSRSQATRMSALADQMSEIAAVNARTSTDAQGAAHAMGGQRVTMADLNKVATQLAGLAEGLAESVDRFDVKAPGQTTTEFATSIDT